MAPAVARPAGAWRGQSADRPVPGGFLELHGGKKALQAKESARARERERETERESECERERVISDNHKNIEC